jgi:putative peptide zinc metalloprotease protein
VGLDPWLDRPLELRPDVESIRGANYETLLFVPERGAYLRLSRSGAAVVGLLDGTLTGAELIEMVAAGGGRDPEAAAATTVRFLEELRTAGALTQTPARVAGRRRLLPTGRWRSPRLALVHRVERVVRLPAVVLQRIPPGALTAGALLAAVSSIVAVVVALANQPPTTTPVCWIAIPLVLGAEVIVHELAHATMCHALDVRVREAGVRLWCFVMPIAYVDRTDAYRVRSRTCRAAIALAGPVVDVTAAGVAASTSLLLGGRAGATAFLILAILVVLLVGNLNPLLPTDGYHTIEAASGELNFRARAFTYVGHRLLRLPLPTAVAASSRARRAVYAVYTGAGTMCCLALVLMVVLLARTLMPSVGGL